MPMISLRFKRKDHTTFLFVESSDSFAKCRARLADVLGIKGGAQALQLLMAPGEGDKAPAEYADGAMVSDFDLTDNSVVFLVMAGEQIDPKLVAAHAAGTL